MGLGIKVTDSVPRNREVVLAGGQRAKGVNSLGNEKEWDEGNPLKARFLSFCVNV